MADQTAIPEDTVLGTPSKELFAEMLTRDVSLHDAISDLVDNCVDGAARLRGADQPDFTGLEIKLRVSDDKFEIEDNCGGIDIPLAQNYAFRFGRPKEADETPHSIGRFGIGMKRALLKLGRNFSVESTTRTERFLLEEDVGEWLEKESWNFKFKEVEKNRDWAEAETGTKIAVWNLYEAVARQFALDHFVNHLSTRTENAHKESIEGGLTVLVNGHALQSNPWKVLGGAGLSPFSKTDTIQKKEKKNVHRRIVVGVGVSSPKDAGWTIICNGRTVLSADQSPLTGWGMTSDTQTVAPKYHNQFARFRGYVFLDSEDSDLLPWNTSKTSVEEESDLYQATRQQMIIAMRPVIDFLNRLDRENEAEEEDRHLNQAISQTREININSVAAEAEFSEPAPPKNPPPPTVGIPFRRQESQVNALKNELKVSSAKAVGEYCFDLTYSRLVED